MFPDAPAFLDRESKGWTDGGRSASHDSPRSILIADLKAALDRSEFELHLQPIVRLADGKIKGFEALARWQRPGCGMVMPSDFISVLEDTKLIIPFGAWLVREACRILREWQCQYPAAEWLSLNINLSARQFEDPFLFETICGLVEDAGLQPSCLRLEVTESLMMRDPEHVAEVLRRFAELGFGVSLDDFGTGYSSLGYLQALPVDSLKIDRCFVTGLETEGGNLRIVRAILGLAASLGLSVVAEGIENAEQAALLSRLGCSHGQGYHFARPLTVRDAAALLNGQQVHHLRQADPVAGQPPAEPLDALVPRLRWAGSVRRRLTLAMTGPAELRPEPSDIEVIGALGSRAGRTGRLVALAPFAMAPMFMALHAGLVMALPGTRSVVSSLCLAVGPALASAACGRAALVAGDELRPNWLLAALAFLFWASGSLLSVWIPMDASAGPVDFSYFLCSVALVLALTIQETDRPRHLFLPLDGLQALLGAVLGYVV
ncbi:MAG: putative bifunctional diguanylate cyclase/phosphodiesterase, partial [Janthinobacterium lividum]